MLSVFELYVYRSKTRRHSLRNGMSRLFMGSVLRSRRFYGGIVSRSVMMYIYSPRLTAYGVRPEKVVFDFKENVNNDKSRKFNYTRYLLPLKFRQKTVFRTLF